MTRERRQSASVTITGAWSEAPLPLRSSRSIDASATRSARAGEPSAKTIREAPQSLDWVFLSPAPEIAPGERTGNYRTADDTPAGDTISAEDFAVAIADEIEQPKHLRARFTVAN